MTRGVKALWMPRDRGKLQEQSVVWKECELEPERISERTVEQTVASQEDHGAR